MVLTFPRPAVLAALVLLAACGTSTEDASPGKAVSLPPGTITEVAPWALNGGRPEVAGLTPGSAESVAERLKEQCLIEAGPVGVGFCRDLASAVARGDDPSLTLPPGPGPLPGDILIRGPWRHMIAIRRVPEGTRLLAVTGSPAERILIGTVPAF